MNMTGKIKAGLGGALIFCMAFIGNCRAGDAADWELAGQSFRGRDLEVKMLEKGTVEIRSAGELLAQIETDLAYNKIKLVNPVFSIDPTNKTIVLTMEGEAGKCIRSLKAVKEGIELATVFPSRFLESVNMRSDLGCAGYDGGWWRSDTGAEGQMIAQKAEVNNTLFTIGTYREGGDEAIACGQLSFWRKDSAVGFSVANSQKNIIYFYDWGKADKEGKPRAMYHVWLYGKKTGKEYQTTLLIDTARLSPDEIQMKQIKSRIRVSPPAGISERYGYIPSGQPLAVEAAILPSKEIAGNYQAEGLILDEADRVAAREVKDIVVTETQEGKVKFNLVAPEKKSLYWLRVNILDKKDGKNYFSREYPFAVIAKLPELKDIPATSPLGGQPLAGGYMPEGRLVGIKWDRFWTGDQTNWKDIEPEKGKFNWEKADKMVDEAVKAGNEILWCLCRTPDWASRLPSDKIFDAIKEKYPVNPVVLKQSLTGTYYGKRISSLFPPRDIKDWENFVRAIVRRYKTKVHYWQVWNEPWWEREKRGKPVGGVILELHMEKGLVVDASPWGFGGSIEDYAEMVKSVSRIVHEEDPLGKVVAYGDYIARDSGDKFYATGVGDYIDILSMHYFYDDYICARNGLPSLSWYPENMKKAVINFSPSSNIIGELKETHFRHTGKNVPVWDTEEGRAKCSTYAGRLGPRPLTQAECEKRFGDKVLDVYNSMMSEHQNACWEAQSLLFSLGIGMEKVFLHCGHSISVSGSGGGCGYKLPTEKGIVWAAMASVLSTSKEAKYSAMGNKELDAITITDIAGKKTAVIWSHTGERKISVAIPVDGGFLLRLGEKLLPSLIKSKDKVFKGMDFLGNPITLKSEKGWLTVDVCEEPSYIHDLDLGDIFVSGRNFISLKAAEKDAGALQVQVGKPYPGEVVVCNPYAGRGINGVLEASVKPGGKIAVEGKMKLAPGEERVIPYNLELDKGVQECELVFVLKEKGVELNRTEIKRRVSIPLPKAERKIEIDGGAGDWEGMAEYKVDTADRVLVGLETGLYEQAPIRIWKGAEDLSFTVRSCWQEDGLYFLVDVKDNETTPGPAPSYQWDCVEFFVDLRDAAGQAKKEKTPGAVQFSVQPCLNDAPKECKIGFAGDDGKYAKAFFTGRKTKTGYVVEGKLEPIGIQLKEGMPIGLDVAIDDGREPNPGNKAERKSQMVWMGTADNCRDTSKWGKFYLGR